MRPTQSSPNSHHSHNANNANATRNEKGIGGFIKRVRSTRSGRVVLGATLTVAVLSVVVVGSNAAGGSFVQSVKKFFGARITESSAAKIQLSAVQSQKRFGPNATLAVTSTQDFGTGTGSQTSQTGSTAFVPNPTSGTTWARAGATAPNAPIVLATASNPLGTTGAYVRGVASTSTSVSKFSPWVAYTGGTEFYTSFKVLFGDSAAGATATSGSWNFYQGAGAMYSDASDFTGAQVFTGLRFTYGAGGALALTYRAAGAFVNTGLTTSTFSSATVYTIDIVGNNKTSGTINYTYAGVARSVAVQKFDLYINGTLIGDDLAEALLPPNTAINAGTFIGISSTANVANAFVDDALVYNAVPADITGPPPTLGTYSLTSVGLSGNVVTANPSAAPANATSITASTTSNFKGTFTVNNTTGIVRVTNAYPAGSYTVTVKAFGPGGTATQTFSLTVSTPAMCTGAVAFVAAPDVSGPEAFQNVTTGDFNNDGKQDLVFARFTNNAIAIRLGDGAGNFSGSGGTGVGASPWGITAGDFNGDGKLDAATANESGQSISFALGDGAGSLAAATTITAGFANNGPKDIRAADMNGDGKLDLVFITGATPGNGFSQIGVAIGDGAGGFAAPTYTSTTVSGGLAYGMAVGDLNNDGNVDVAVAHYIGSTLSVSFGNGTGGFTSTATYSSGSVATFVALGDVNNANGPDLIGTFAGGTTAPFANNGAGIFSPLATLATPGAQSVVIGDFNRDGKPDLGVAEAGAVKQTSIWLGSGTGTFTASGVTSGGFSPVGSTIGDVNGDGYQDILTANGNGSSGIVTVRLGVCSPKVTTTGTLANFGNVAVGGTSAEQTYTVSGSALTNDITVTAPSTDFQVSKTTATGFGPSITFTQSGGSVPTSTVFVRFRPQSAGAKTGNIANASTGATTQNVAVSGTGVAPILNVTTDPVVTEGNAGTILATFTVTLTPASSQTVTVHYSTQDNTATTADNDYVGLADTLLTFLPTETTKNIAVTVNGDTNYEPNEQFFFNINTPANANISDNQGIGTITNDDTAPSSPTDHFRTTAGGGDWSSTSKWESSPTGSDPWIPATLVPTTAANTITITASTGVDVTTNVSADQLFVNGGLTVKSGGTLTIADGTGTDLTEATAGQLGIEGTGLFVNNGQTSLAGTVSRVGQPPSGTGSITGNALVYTGTASTLFYNSNGFGSTSTNDTEFPAANGPNKLWVFEVEGLTLHADRTVLGEVQLQSGAVSTGSNTLTLGPGCTSPRNSGSPFFDPFDGYVIGNLQRTFAAAGLLTFDVGTANGYSPVTVNTTAGIFPANFTVKAIQGAMPGISGANKLARYWTLTNTTITSANLTFNYLAGDVTGSFASYQFIKKTGGTLSILAPTGTPTSTQATINGVTSFSDWTLAETNAVQFGTIQFSSAAYSVGEGDGNASITVTRSGGSDGDVSIHYATSDVAALDGSDYTSQSGTFNWAAGDATTRTITVPITNDTTYEGNEDFNVDLDAPGGGATLGAFTGAVVNIIENDSAPSFSIDDVQHNEGDVGTTSYAFTVTKTGATASNAEVDFITQIGSATTADNDYVAQSGTLLFTPSDTTKQIIVLVNGDTNVEPDETFKVHLSNPQTATISDADGTGSITNDDAAPPTLGSFSDTSVALSGNATITPDAAPTNTTSISVATSSSFKGTFAANPATGVVQVTDAHPSGAYTVTVTAFGSGGTTSRTFILTVQTGTACTDVTGFTNAAAVSVGGNPKAIAIGDFNGDGKQDFAVPDSDANIVSIRLGSGTGTFTNAADVSVADFPTGIAIGDFNGDGKQDLAVATQNFGIVSIRLGSGTGTFISAADVTAGGFPYSIAIGDFNGDGKQDLAVASQNDGLVSIRLGSGTGMFTNAADVDVGDFPYSIAIGDFNNDGKQDLAVVNGDPATISIRLGSGTGTFTSAADVIAGTNPLFVAIGDFNNDGKQDLAVGSVNPATVSIRLGSGTGTFTNAADVNVGDYPNFIAVGDFNNDGKQDLAVANNNSATVSIRLGSGLGTFTAAADISTASTTGIAIGDFNGDGKQDLAIGNPGFGVVDIRLGACLHPGSLQFSAANYDDNETNVTHDVTITVTRTGGTDGAVAVHYETSNGSALTADSDYTAASGDLMWANGDSAAKTFTVSVTGDPKFEPAETINLTLSAPTGGAGLGTPATATITIQNDDDAPTFAIDDVTHNEGDAGTTSYVFTVTKTGNTALSSSVNFTTVDGSATLADNDYQLNSGTLTFTAVQTTQQITVLVNGDTTVEPNEAFSVNLNTPVDSTISDANGTGTITNDDNADTDVSVSGGNLVITDANGANTDDTLTISLVGSNIRINDPNHILTAVSGTTQIDANTVEAPFASITGSIQVNTLGGNDTLTLALAGGDFIPAGGVSYAGGTQTSVPGDRLAITGGAQGTVTYNYTNANDGSVVMSNFGTVSYTGLEPITNSGNATDVVFNLPAGPNAATLSDDVASGNTMSRLSGATFEQTDFANPTGSLTINRGNAGDTLAVNALPDFNASLTVGTGALPFSTINFNGEVTLASNKNLSADASSTISLPNATSDLATSGTGTISLTTARDISLANGPSITTVNGALTLNANTAGTTAGIFAGISFDDGIVQATGTGLVTVTGHGGTGGGIGIYMTAGQVEGGTTGTVTLSGTGGLANGIGIWLDSANSLVTSTGANVQVTGTGGGTGAAANNAGMLQTEGAVVTAGGSGSVTLLGTGGIGSGGNNIGFQIAQSSQVTSGGGNIQITGLEGQASTAIDFNAGSITTVTNGGNITVIGNSISVNATITANASSSVTFRPFTNGTAIDLGGADSIGGPLGLTDFELDKVNAGALNIGATNSGAITVTSAITRAAATALNLTSGANIDFSTGSLNSNGGNVSLIPGTNVFPATTGTDVTTSAATTLTLTSLKDLKIVINNTTVDSGYTQLNVAGLVNLNNANLSFTGSGYTPVGGESFIIVNNDGADAITGTFNGLAEGATITNFLGSPLNATITYAGGTNNNDVVLTAVSPCTPPSTVYVDDSWVGTTIGTDPDAGGPATNFGCDSFATIQDGINGVTVGGTVIVRAGNYFENPNINKSVSLQGAQFGVDARARVASESIVRSNGPAPTAVFAVTGVSNVTIDGFTLDGDDPGFVGITLTSGDDTNTSYGVRPTGTTNNLTVSNNIIKKVAIGLRGDVAGQGSVINQNLFDSIGFFDFGYAVSIRNNFYANVTNNKMTRSWTGVHINNHNGGGGPASFNITGNEIHSYAGGILYWLQYNGATGATFNNNQMTAEAGAVANNFGVLMVSIQNAVNPTFTNNTMTGHNYGVGLFNVPTTSTITLGSTNSISISTLAGVFLTDNLNFNPVGTTNFLAGGPGAASTVNVTGMPITGSTGIGIKVEGASTLQTVNATSNTITGVTTGLALQSANARITAHFNRIIATTTAIDNPDNVVTDLENNWWGCNAGPGNTGCGAVNGTGADFDPWIVLAISASPSTIPPGGSTTITADMTHNSAAAVPSVTDFVPQVAVTFGATNGTVLPTSGTIVNGQATTTFTSNSTSSGTASATVDNQTVNTPVNVSAANTYTWNPTLGTDFNVAVNWTPLRVLPQTTDVLVVNGTSTPAPIITGVPTQTIAALHLINGPGVTLQTIAANTLTINGGVGGDFTVPSPASLTLDGANGLTIKVSGVGTTGTISGGVIVQGAGLHRLFGDANGVITFQSGGFATTVSGFTGNMFGAGTAGNGDVGSVIFQSGSTYFHNAGGSPFGTVGNGPVVTFQTGSTAEIFSAANFQANGRTYADIKLGALLNPINASDSGGGNFQFDNLTLRSGSAADTTLTFTGSGTSTINIRGNITSTNNGNGGTLPDLFLTPGSGGTHINKIGGGTIIFSTTGNARAIDLEGGATVENGTTLALSRVVLLGLSNPHLQFLNIDSTADITGGPTGYVVGSLARFAVPNGSSSFPVGTAGAYSPVDLANSIGGGSLTVVARTPQQPLLAAGTSLHRYWSLTQETGALTTDLTFHYLDSDVVGNENGYQLVIVKTGNATSFPNSCPNTCVDPSVNTIHRSGVSTFSDWTAAEPAAPTAVKLVDFNALQTGNDVVLSWQTGYEARNLGYNLYREQGGRRVAITPSLVAGSALLAGSNTKLSSGLSYTWYDDLRDVRNQKSPVNYWLEDVDINGTRTMHGPIAVSDCASMRADCKQLSSRHSSRLLSQVSTKGSTAGVQFRGWPVVPAALTPDLGGEQTKAPKSADADADDLARQQTLIEARPGVKIAVSKEGWYRVTQPELVAAGLDPDADATHLQLYVNGQAVPIKLSVTSGQLTSSDYLEFYGQGLASTTDTAQTYYLTLADGVGTRVRSPFPDTLAPPNGPSSFAYTIERKERMIYFSGLLNGPAENFFGQIVTSGQTLATIPVSRLDSETTAQLAVTLQGVTSQSHAVRVSLNGNDLGSVLFTNTGHATETFNISGVNLVEGDNTIGLTASDGGDVSLVDVIRLTYGHKYLADNNRLEVLVSDGETKQFGGFSNANIRVIDVTSPAQVKELTPAANVTSLDDGSFAVDVRVPGATNLKQHKVLVFTEETSNTVDSVRANNPSSWWSETAGADYLIITTDYLKASVASLTQLRSNQGLAVRVIDVEDLYDEFSFGEHSPQAVRDFLAKATIDWTTKPRYVVFAGDASYDPKNYLGFGLNDLVPTRLIDTSLSETASDDWLADFNNDGMADFAIGRLPVRTATEMNALVAKIVNYENASPDPSRGALLVSDNGFEAPSTMVQSLLPAGMTVATINRSSADDATIHNQIVAGINQGPRVVNYIGHGSNGVWTGASLLSSNDAPNLTNTNRLSVFTMMTCYNGFFQDAANDSLSEALLKAPGGAVAVWASTTLTQPEGQNAIDQEFYRMLFGVQPATLGDAARGAKLVTGDADVRRTWTLFGDPAMRLR